MRRARLTQKNKIRILVVEVKIPVFKTLILAIELFKRDFNLIIKSLFVPNLALCAIYLLADAYLNHLEDPLTSSLVYQSFHLIASFSLLGILILTLVVVMNISFRIAINGQPGNISPKSSELKSMLKQLQLGALIVLGYFLIGLFLSFIFPVQYSRGGYLGEVNEYRLVMLATFFIGFALLSFPYIISRFIFLFAATAVGERLTMKQAFNMTDGNGFKLMMLLTLPLVPVHFLDLIIFSLVSDESVLINLCLLFLSTQFLALSYISIGLAYKSMVMFNLEYLK